jgi:hypothetical protein
MHKEEKINDIEDIIISDGLKIFLKNEEEEE